MNYYIIIIINNNKFEIHFFQLASLMLVTFVQSVAPETVTKFALSSLTTNSISLSGTCFWIALLKKSLTELTALKAPLQMGHVLLSLWMHPAHTECEHGDVTVCLILSEYCSKQIGQDASVFNHCISIVGLTTSSWPVLFYFIRTKYNLSFYYFHVFWIQYFPIFK